MKILHVAAMPFPSPQGTQGLVRAMCEASAEAGHETHLLAYDAPRDARSFRCHSLLPFATRVARRSGPTWHKAALDACAVPRVRSLVARHAPELVVAHHVEAALAVWASGVRPFTFVAHTSLEAELPCYFSPILRSVVARSGGALDAFLCRHASTTLAVSPLLSELLRVPHTEVRTLSLPWRVPVEPSELERSRARAALGLASTDQVVLYAGNLDAYQGLPAMLLGVGAAARRLASLRLLVATESDARRLRAQARSLALAHILTLTSLADEAQRRLVHAACDLALVPRLAPGGVPIKLLDALSRGVPVVAAPRAGAGLALGGVCTQLTRDDPEAWAAAIQQCLTSSQRAEQAESARNYVRIHHDPARFVRELLGAAREATRVSAATSPKRCFSA